VSDLRAAEEHEMKEETRKTHKEGPLAAAISLEKAQLGLMLSFIG
jgi:hypothetical protein